MTDEELKYKFDSLRLQGTKTNKKRTEDDLRTRFDYLQAQGTQQAQQPATQPVAQQPVQPVVQPTPTAAQPQVVQTPVQQTTSMADKLRSGARLTPEETIQAAVEMGRISPEEGQKRLNGLSTPTLNKQNKTIENATKNTITKQNESNKWTTNDDIAEFGDTLKTIGKGTVVFGGRALDAINTAKNAVELNDTSAIPANYLLDYANGKRDVASSMAFVKLKNIAENSDRADDLDLKFLYNAIKEGKYAGNENDIKNILNKSQAYYHDKAYRLLVQPSLEKYEQQKQENIEKYPGIASDIMNTGSDILSHGIPTVLGMAVNPTAGLALSGGVTGETKMQQYLENGKDYSEAAKNVPIETAKGIAFGKILEVASPVLKAGIKPDMSTLARAGRAFVNGFLVGGGASLATQSFDLLKEDPNYDFIDWNKVENGIKTGTYNSLEDYLNSDEYKKDVAGSRAKQLGISALMTAAFNTAGQVKQGIKANQAAKATQASNEAKADEYLKTLGLKRGATEEQVRKAARQLSAQFHPDRNPGFEEQFNQVRTAYAELSKPEFAFVYGKGIAPTTVAAAQQPVNTANAVASDQALVPYAGNAIANEAQTIVPGAVASTQRVVTPQVPTEAPKVENVQSNIENKITTDKALSNLRDFQEVGSRQVNAYQYENPEVKPFFQYEAKSMLEDLNNAIKGERWLETGKDYGADSYASWNGVKRDVTKDIAKLLDGDNGVKLSYDDIRKGLEAIIKDQGSENIAAAKRIELVIDNRLRNGYTDSYGYKHDPSENYNNFLNGKEYIAPEEYDNNYLIEQYGDPNDTAGNLNETQLKEITNYINDITNDNTLDSNYKEQILNRFDNLHGYKDFENIKQDVAEYKNITDNKPLRELSESSTNILPSNEELQQVEANSVAKDAKALNLEMPNQNLETTMPTAEGTSQPPEPPSDETDEKVAELLKQRPERAKMTRTQKLEDAYRSLVNKGYYVDKLADVSENQQLKYKYDKMLSSANEGNYVVGEKQTDNNGNVIGKSVNEIWKPVEDAGKVEEFSDYLLHKLNIDRMSLEDINALTEAETELSDFIKGNPELTKLSPRTIQRIADGKAVLENGKIVKVNPNLRDSITKEVKTTELQDLAKKYLELDKQAEILEGRKNKPVFGETVTADDSRAKVAEYEEKYPEFKEWDNDIKTFNKNQLQNMVDAGLTSEETQQLLNDMYDNYIRIQRQVGGDRPITNQRGRLKVNSPIKKAKGGNQDILPLKDSMAQQALEVKKAIARNQFGQELLNTLKNGEQVEDYGEVLMPSKNGEAPTFTVFVDGQPVTMKINEELYDAIKPSERASWEDGIIARGLQKGVVLQKTLLTSRNPIFAFTNFVRDLQTAIVNSKDTPKMLQNYAKLAEYKFAELYSKATGKELSDANKEIGRLWDLYKANGGEANTYFDFEKGTNLEEKNPVKRAINNGIEKVFALNEIIEQMPRVSEFITTLENGGTLDEAMYNAADITVNFKRGGDMAKMLDRNGASFLNASIQGLDKQIRNFTDDFKSGNKGKAFANLIIKAALIGIAPALVNHLLLSDDEDYQDLPDYIKDNYWLFKIGDDKFLRIPRGRDIPTFLGNIAQRTTRALQGEEHAFDGLVDTFSNTLAPNNPIEDNVFAPLVAMGTNKSWNGSDIVSSTLQNKVPSQQYDAKDTEFAKWLGEKINISPKKIDYLLDQYSGGLGDILIPMNTKYAEEGNALGAKFTTDSINSNKQLSRFYDDKTELTQKKNSNVATEQEQYQYNYFVDVGDEISKLNKQIKETEMSDASDKEKISKVTELRKQMNNLAKEANTNSKKYGEVANDYSDDIYEGIYNSDLYKDTYDKDKFKEKIRKKVAEDANAKAKEAIGDTDAAFKLNTTIEELDNAKIPLADYYLAWYAQSNLALGSTYAAKQKAIRDNTDLTKEQEDVLFGIFNIEYKKGSK